MLRIEIKSNSDDDDEDLFGSNTKTNTRSDNIFDKIEQDTSTNFGNYDTKKDTGNIFMPASEQPQQIEEKPEEISDTIEYVFERDA